MICMHWTRTPALPLGPWDPGTMHFKSQLHVPRFSLSQDRMQMRSVAFYISLHERAAAAFWAPFLNSQWNTGAAVVQDMLVL